MAKALPAITLFLPSWSAKADHDGIESEACRPAGERRTKACNDQLGRACYDGQRRSA